MQPVVGTTSTTDADEAAYKMTHGGSVTVIVRSVYLPTASSSLLPTLYFSLVQSASSLYCLCLLCCAAVTKRNNIMMKTILLVSTICAMFITLSGADIKQASLDIQKFKPVLGPDAKDVCSSSLIGGLNYSVSAAGLDSPQMRGCAQVESQKTGNYVKKSFKLWLNQHDNQQCGQEGMEYIIFSCLGMPFSSQEITKYGSQFIRLYGKVPNKKGEERLRCGLFEKELGDSKVLRLAISGDHLCTGLSDFFTDIFPRVNKGSKLLELTIDPEYQSRFKRSTYPANEVKPKKNHNWYYMWMLG